MIWKVPIDLKTLNDRASNTLISHMRIVFIEVGDDYLKAKMPVAAHVLQPMGIMHGGASCVLAETVASCAANFCVDFPAFYCVGLDINTNHIRSVSSGELTALTRPYHLGKSTQVWAIDIHDAQQRLISVSRLTVAVLQKNVCK